MTAEEFLLYLFVAMAASSATGILVVRNVFSAALFLIVCLLSIAGIYLMLHAEFLGVVQIMIYAGGVLVLILFGIMLTVRLSGKKMEASYQNQLAGLMAAAALLGLLIFPISELLPSEVAQTPDMTHHVAAVGRSLFTTYSAPFEVAGILLLISLIAASVTATHSLRERNP